MKILVVSACTKDKKYKSSLKCKDLDNEDTKQIIFGKWQKEKAKNMYTGKEHRHIKKAVHILSNICTTEWYIISAGFGLINSYDKIVPYECTFSVDKESLLKRAQNLGIETNKKGKKELIKLISESKRIEEKLEKLYHKNYDLIFFILGTNYIYAISDAIRNIPNETKSVFFVSANTEKIIPDDCYKIKSTSMEMKKLKTMMIELKGSQFLNLSQNLKNNTELIKKIKNNPNLIYELSIKQTKI